MSKTRPLSATQARQLKDIGCYVKTTIHDSETMERVLPGQPMPENFLTMCPVRTLDHGAYVGDAMVGADHIRWLLKHGITPELAPPTSDQGPRQTCSIGRATKGEHAGKWIGWSHRAACAFGVGSEVKPGDCAFVASTPEEAQAEMLAFWGEGCHLNTHIEREGTDDEGRPGCWVAWIYSPDTPNEKIRGKTGSVFHAYPQTWGRGAWTAQTDEDARQMAINFANAVD